MKSLLLVIIFLLMIAQFVVLFCLDLFAKTLYFRAKGSTKGYSPRKVVKNIDAFTMHQNGKLAQKVRILDYILWGNTLATILLSLFYLLAKELGWL